MGAKKHSFKLSFDHWMSVLLHSPVGSKEKKFAFRKMKKKAKTFRHWLLVRFCADETFDLEKKNSLYQMMNLAKTLEEWGIVLRCTKEGSEERKTALKRIKKLEKSSN